MTTPFYPLTFYPILKERIWGGTKLKTYLNKPITSDITGESWEISTVENDVSIVSNGNFEGKSLNDLIMIIPKPFLERRHIRNLENNSHYFLNTLMLGKTYLFSCIPMMLWRKGVIILSGKPKCGM